MTDQQFNEMMEVLERIAENTELTASRLSDIRSDMPMATSKDIDDLYKKLGDIESALLNG